MNGKRNNLILKFEFLFTNSLKIIAFFLDFWAKKSKLDYSIKFDKNMIYLYVSGNDKELSQFNDEFICLVPHSIFLQSSKVELSQDLPKSDEFKFDKKFKNITPFGIKSGKNEFGYSSNDELVKNSVEILKSGKEIVCDGYEISIFNGFDCDYFLPTNLKVVPKIFVCDQKSLIALASYEKPIINLRTTSIFRTNHANSPMYFDLRAAWDMQIHKITTLLYQDGINFLKVKSLKKEFKLSVLDDSFLVVRNTDFLLNEDLDFIMSKKDKNLALFELTLKEFELLNKKAVARIFLSRLNDDFIKIYKEDSEFLVFKISLPKSYDEIYEKISSFEGGKSLLENYKKSYELPNGDINLPNNFYSIFTILDEILDFKGNIFNNAKDFGGTKGVRIDFKMENKNEFDYIKMIRSAMSFKLAGAEPKNLSYGCFESLAYFISDFGDILKDEFDCDEMLLSGEMFKHKMLSNLVLKFSNSNYRARFSEYYPLEIT